MNVTRRRPVFWAAILTGLSLAAPLFAQEPFEPRMDRFAKELEELRKSTETLKKENQELREALRANQGAGSTQTTLSSQDVRSIVSSYLDETEAKSKNGAASASGGNKSPDPAVVGAGQAAFERSCTKCHEASRALERTKDLSGWRATVRRMANKSGANIASADMEPIAAYLASRGAEDSGTAAERPAAADVDKSSFSAFASLGPSWRGGNSHIQDTGFLPEAWVGGTWQGKVLSARATACAACHGVKEDPGTLQRIELAEAVVRIDLSQWLNDLKCGMKGGVEAGRFVVPFGAFSAQVNPSLYRTVSKPLIFNMGQRVFRDELGNPVLPLPYVDEGADLNLEIPIADLCTGPLTATIDSYLVNGLESGDNGVEFYKSRDLVDNNGRVAWGARATIGGPNVRAGASWTSGCFNQPGDNQSTFTGHLNYTIFGFDIQARYKNLVRFQVEYAKRNSDRANDFGNGLEAFSEKLDGYYAEAELRPWGTSPVSLLLRYDFLRRNSLLPPPDSTLPDSRFNVERFTSGINIKLWRESLLMLDYELWLLPGALQLHNQNVYGVRYAITF